MSNNRNTKMDGNKVYTMPQWVDKTIAVAKQYTDAQIMIDPCAGAGAFVEGLRRAGLGGYGYDIAPANQSITTANLFSARLFKYPVITNPPFSRTMATDVFNHLASCRAPFIIMFWPASYRKWSKIDGLDRHYELVHNELFLGPQKFFEGPRKKDTMNMCIQVWKRTTKMQRRPDTKPKTFIRLQDYIIKGKYKSEVPTDRVHYKFCYLGYSCGKIMDVKPYERYPKNVYHYLSIDTPDWIMKTLRDTPWSSYYNNVGQMGSKSLSLTEINYELDTALSGNTYD